MIRVGMEASFGRILKLVKEWPRRTRALRKVVAHDAARKTLAGLLERIPNDEAWKAYRASLQISEITVGGQDEVAYALRAKPKSRGISGVDDPVSVLYVRVRSRTRTPKKSIQILEKYSPWTLDTIPFLPERTDAVVFQRNTTKSNRSRVRRMRKKDRVQWEGELTAAGVSLSRVKERNRRTMQVVPDVAYRALQLEFGRGVKPEPHWRPTLRNLTSTGMRGLGRNPKVRMLFENSSFTGWKRWEKIDTPTKVSVGDAKKYVPFQQKLGIRV